MKHQIDPRQHIPEWVICILEWMSAPRNRDDVIGDFTERFEDYVDGRSTRAAWIWLAGELIRSLPALIVQRSALALPAAKMYFANSFRHMVKKKSVAALNIFGLAIGMASCLLIMHYVAHERNYDRFHESSSDLYRIVVDGVERGDGSHRNTNTWMALGAAIADQSASVEETVRLHTNGAATLSYQPESGERQILNRTSGFYADPNFFEVFNVRVDVGDAEGALSSTDKVLISESLAARIFGAGDPIGEVLQIEGWSTGEFEIAGVFEDLPAYTHFSFDYLLPFRVVSDLSQYASRSGWFWQNVTTYVRLTPGSRTDELAIASTELIRNNVQDPNGTIQHVRAEIQPIVDIHLKPGGEPSMAYWRVHLLGIVGLLVLAIAWMNYVNLTTAGSLERAREIAVRKTIGATHGNVIAQFVVEAIMTNGLALVMAGIIVFLALPFAENKLGFETDLAFLFASDTFVVAGILFFSGLILSSLYPAIVLSRFKPMSLFRSQSTPDSGKNFVQRVLVTAQFSIATALLIGTVAVQSQLGFMENTDLGMALDQLVVVEQPSRSDRSAGSSSFLHTVSQVPYVESITSGAVPGSGFFMDMPARRPGSEIQSNIAFQAVFVDQNFLPTYELELLAGRNFLDFETDGMNTIINETGARFLGFDTPDEALGQRVVFNEAETNFVTIVGVVADFNWMSLKQRVGAVGLLINRSIGPFTIRVEAQHVSSALVAIQEAFRDSYPASAFEYAFVDERFNEQYYQERQWSNYFSVFTALALLVACMGLVGMIAHVVVQRTKEVSVRKIMGASPLHIGVILISKLAAILIVAFVMAVPASLLVIKFWLSSYANPMELTVGLFLFPCLVVLALAFITVGFHAQRAARMRPVDVLRS